MADNSPTRFLDYQVNTFGMPVRRPRQRQASATATGTTFMPNGQPQPQPQQPPPAPAPPTQPLQAGDPRLGTQGSVDSRGVYTPGQAPNYVYNMQNVPQFQQPRGYGIEQEQGRLIRGILQNPQTMSPEVIAQMQGRSRDQAALMQQQTGGQLAQRNASRGMGDSSGYANAQQRQLQSDTNRGLLDQFRNIEIQAAQQNRADELAALGAGDSFLGNQMGRATQGYQNRLAGLQQGRTEQQSFIDSLMNRFGMQEDLLGRQSGSIQNANSADLQRRGLDQSNAQWMDEMELRYRQQQAQEEQQFLQYLMGGDY